MPYMYIPGTCSPLFWALNGPKKDPKRRPFPFKTGVIWVPGICYNSTSPKSNPTIFGPKDSFADICWHARSSVERGHTPHRSAVLFEAFWMMGHWGSSPTSHTIQNPIKIVVVFGDFNGIEEEKILYTAEPRWIFSYNINAGTWCHQQPICRFFSWNSYAPPSGSARKHAQHHPSNSFKFDNLHKMSGWLQETFETHVFVKTSVSPPYASYSLKKSVEWTSLHSIPCRSRTLEGPLPRIPSLYHHQNQSKWVALGDLSVSVEQTYETKITQLTSANG